MKEQILNIIAELEADLFGQMTEADNAYDNDWSRQILAQQDILNELKDRIRRLAE